MSTAATLPLTRVARLSTLLPLLLLVLTPLTHVSALAGDVATIDGVPHVQNGAAPAEGVTAVQLDEIWRAGGDDDEVFFGAVGRVLVDEAGNYYLMDSQLSEVYVYSPEGEHLRTLGGEGDGPGEIRNPNDMFFMPNGAVGMVQAFPGRVVLIDREGKPAGSYNYNAGNPAQGQFAVLIRSMCRGDNIVLGGIRMSFSQDGTSNQTYFFARCDADGAEQHRYCTRENQITYANLVMDEGKMDFPWGRSALAADGTFFVAPERNAYAIQVFTPEGKLVRVIEREFESLVRNAEQTQQARLTFDAVGRNYPAPVQEVIVEETEPDIAAIHVADDGSLWVRSSRSENERRDGVLTTYDVFNADGDFRRQVEIVGPGDPNKDAVFVLEGNRVVVVMGALDAFRTMQGVSAEEGEDAGEDTPLEVICYTMGD